MLIDWFTVCAQVLNFLILVGLLMRFLYKPILHAIDEREKRVAASLADAAEKAAGAQRERELFAGKNEELDKRRDALLAQAAEAAEAQRQRLLEEARRDAAALSAKLQALLKNESKSACRAIGHRVEQEVLAIARKAMTDLAGTSLEARMVEVFIRRLGELDASAKAELGTTLRKKTARAIVRSAFELPVEQRAAIGTALKTLFATDGPLRFETAPNLIGGIELVTDGQKAKWNIADYMAVLEKGVAETVDAQIWADLKLHPDSPPDEAKPGQPAPPAQTGKAESTGS